MQIPQYKWNFKFFHKCDQLLFDMGESLSEEVKSGNEIESSYLETFEEFEDFVNWVERSLHRKVHVSGMVDILGLTACSAFEIYEYIAHQCGLDFKIHFEGKFKGGIRESVTEFQYKNEKIVAETWSNSEGLIIKLNTGGKQ